MADRPISLSKHRKARARMEARRKADANVAKFGRTKAQKQQDEADARRDTQRLDDHKRDPLDD